MKKDSLEYVVDRHRIVRMGLLDLLKTAQRAIVIQCVEAVIGRAHLRLPIQRIGVDDPFLCVRVKSRERAQNRVQTKAATPISRRVPADVR